MTTISSTNSMASGPPLSAVRTRVNMLPASLSVHYDLPSIRAALTSPSPPTSLFITGKPTIPRQVVVVEPLVDLLAQTRHVVAVSLQQLAVADLGAWSLERTLTSLSLESCGLEDVSALVGILAPGAPLRSLSLSSNKIVDLSPLARPLAHPACGLRSLHVRSNRVASVQPLAGAVQLAHVDLAHNLIRDISPLTSNGALLHLDVSANHLTDLEPLARTSLLQLKIGNNPATTLAPFVDSLRSNHTLTHLDIGGRLGASHWSADVAALLAVVADPASTIESLNLTSFQGIDVSQLRSNVLRELNLGRVRSLASSDFAFLNALPALTKLDLRSCAINDPTALADALRTNTSITHLNLASNRISSASSLAANGRLTHLDLSANPIQDIEAIGLALRGNPTLARLNLRNPAIQLVALILNDANRARTCLQLERPHHLEFHHLDERQLACALRHLHRNTSTTTLAIHDTPFDDAAVSLLCVALRDTTTLSSLTLTSCSLRRLEPLCEALASNRSLRSLNLAHNRFRSVAPLANTLLSNTTLRRLSLDDNPLACSNALSDALATNTALLELSIRSRSFRFSRSLLLAMETNRTLTHIEGTISKVIRAQVMSQLFANRRERARLDGMATFLVAALHASPPATPFERFRSASTFDLNTVGVVFSFLDGKPHRVDFRRRKAPSSSTPNSRRPVKKARVT